MAGSSPTVRKRQLGMELRRLRDAVGKTQLEAGEWLDLPDTSISKMENGKQRVSVSQCRSFLQLYDVGSPHADYLLQLCRESAQRGWWAVYGKTVPPWFADYVGMETAAAEVWTYESDFIPGLLQIPEYAEAVTGALYPARTPAEVQRTLQLKATRQQRLSSSEQPLILRAVINEAALRRDVGGPEVMRAQVQRIAEAAALPNVTVQVLPFTAGAHPGMFGAFTALRFPEEPMNTVYLESYGAALYVEAPADVARYAETFERLSRLALDAKETTRLLDKIAKEHR